MTQFKTQQVEQAAEEVAHFVADLLSATHPFNITREQLKLLLLKFAKAVVDESNTTGWHPDQ